MNNKVIIFYCRESDRYYIYDQMFTNNSNYSQKLLKIHKKNDIVLKDKRVGNIDCPHDIIIKENLTEREAENFLLIILKLKSISE